LFPAVPVLLFVIVVCLSGCSQDTAPAVYKNQPPTVWIAAGPVEGSIADGYRIGFEWGGWDPDGKIAHFEYCITDNNGAFDPEDTTGTDKWNRTTKTADVFKFTADEPVDPDGDDLAAEFRRSHTFFIRSVDEVGVPSPSPVYRSFTARTLSPDVDIDAPPYLGLNPARVPPISTFRWHATDYENDMESTREPESVSWILEPRLDHNNDWQETIDWIRALPVDAPEWGSGSATKTRVGTEWPGPPRRWASVAMFWPCARGTRPGRLHPSSTKPVTCAASR
jgi:hypothetical protein